MRHRVVFHGGVIDFVAERRIDLHRTVGGERNEALRKVDIVGGKRAANLALGNAAIEGPVERLIGDLDRIVRRGVELRAR